MQRTLDNNPVSTIASNATAVTPSDETIFQKGCLYIGTGGTIVVRTAGGQDATFVNIPNGSFLPVLVDMVYSTGLVSADNILLVY